MSDLRLSTNLGNDNLMFLDHNNDNLNLILENAIISSSMSLGAPRDIEDDIITKMSDTMSYYNNVINESTEIQPDEDIKELSELGILDCFNTISTSNNADVSKDTEISTTNIDQIYVRKDESKHFCNLSENKLFNEEQTGNNYVLNECVFLHNRSEIPLLREDNSFLNYSENLLGDMGSNTVYNNMHCNEGHSRQPQNNPRVLDYSKSSEIENRNGIIPYGNRNFEDSYKFSVEIDDVKQEPNDRPIFNKVDQTYFNYGDDNVNQIGSNEGFNGCYASYDARHFNGVRGDNYFHSNSYSNSHNIPKGDEFLRMIQNPQIHTYEMCFLENKSIFARNPLPGVGVGFDIAMLIDAHKQNETERDVQEARETERRILTMYPMHNLNYQRKY